MQLTTRQREFVSVAGWAQLLSVLSAPSSAISKHRATPAGAAVIGAIADQILRLGFIRWMKRWETTALR